MFENTNPIVNNDDTRMNQDKELYLLIKMRKPSLELVWNGICHYCEESVEEPKLYCSDICADAHDKQLARLSMK